MQIVENRKGSIVLQKMVDTVKENKGYLGEIDGLIGDGDHGMNMNKGFALYESRYGTEDISISQGLTKLGRILLEEIGGSMGPIYGTVFLDMAVVMERGSKEITLADFTECLEAGLQGLLHIVDARVGDKTLVDVLTPAVEALKQDVLAGNSFRVALEHMTEVAEAGKESTKGMIARFGRSSRLGERSRGVPDAGACSCALLLKAMAEGMESIMAEGLDSERGGSL